MKSTDAGIRHQSGFTLTELALVVAIVALLIGGTVMTLAAQNSAREITDTRRALEQAREGVLGFAIRFGRLPCPASDGSIDVDGAGTTPTNGRESFCTNAAPGACAPNTTTPQAHGRCSNPDNGYLPAVTLGVGPVANTPPVVQGLLLDAWLSPLRYVVSQRDLVVTVVGPPPTPDWIALNKPFTSADGLKKIVLVPSKSPAAYPPAEALQITTGGAVVVAPVVIYSYGRNRSVLGVGTDEQENGDLDLMFVEREPSPPGTAAEFDDLLIWIPSNQLFNRLIAAGAI